LPYVVDLQTFLGRNLIVLNSKEQCQKTFDFTKDVVIGEIPQGLLDGEHEYVTKAIKEDASIANIKNVTLNAYKLYYKTRASASKEAYQKAKEISAESIAPHPWLLKHIDQKEIDRVDILKSLKNFRPAETIFEAAKKTHSDAGNVLMKSRRSQMEDRIKNHSLKAVGFKNIEKETVTGEMANELEIKETFKDEQFYVPYQPKDTFAEKGYAITGNSFVEQANKSVIDFTGGDEAEQMMKQQKALKWDKKKKRYIRETVGADNKKRIRTESGALIPASYKTNAYDEWVKKHNINLPRNGDAEVKIDKTLLQRKRYRQGSEKKDKNRSELKNKEQIHKNRKTKQKLQERHGRPSRKKQK
jgi:ATP-dependent RNA helicase DDX54/DBP10